MSDAAVLSRVGGGHRSHVGSRAYRGTGGEGAVDVGQGDAAAARGVDAQVAVGALVVGHRAGHRRSDIPAGRRVVAVRSAREVEAVLRRAGVGDCRVVVTLADVPRLADVERRQDVAGRRLGRARHADHAREGHEQHREQRDDTGSSSLWCR